MPNLRVWLLHRIGSEAAPPQAGMVALRREAEVAHDRPVLGGDLADRTPSFPGASRPGSASEAR
jgi:hypothetical protein